MGFQSSQENLHAPRQFISDSAKLSNSKQIGQIMRKSQIFDTVPENSSSLNASVLGKKQNRSISKNASTLAIKMDDSSLTP